MLSNEDIAELIESTRERVQHMGGETPAARGVVRVLDGLIAMLREQAPAEQQEQKQEQEQEVEQPVRRSSPQAASRASYEREAGQDDESSSSESSEESVPGYLQHLRQTRRRRPVRETAAPPKAANPLSNPQYAGFFNALIASQKGDAGGGEGESKGEAEGQNAEEEEESSSRRGAPEPAVRSSVNPQYKGFFDALTASQKGRPAASESEESSSEEQESASSSSGELESPASSAHSSGASAPYRDETATG